MSCVSEEGMGEIEFSEGERAAEHLRAATYTPRGIKQPLNTKQLNQSRRSWLKRKSKKGNL